MDKYGGVMTTLFSPCSPPTQAFTCQQSITTLPLPTTLCPDKIYYVNQRDLIFPVLTHYNPININHVSISGWTYSRWEQRPLVL